MTVTMMEIAIDEIAEDGNVRNELTEIDSLAASIRKVGVLQPLVVTSRDGDQPYLLVAGARRLAASRKAGLRAVPAVVRDLGTDAAAAAARAAAQLAENLARIDLTPMEEAQGVLALTEHGMSQAEIAGVVGRSKTWVSERKRMAGLPPRIAQAVADGGVSIKVAQKAASLDEDEQAKVVEAIENGYSPEWAINNAKAQAKNAAALAKIEERLEKLREAGVTVLAEDEFARRLRGEAMTDGPRDEGYRRVMTPKDGDSWVPDNVIRLDERKHRKEPCHAVYLSTGGWQGPALWAVCTEPKRHTPEGDSDLVSPDAERKAKEQADRRAENKRKKEAKERRLVGLAALAAKGTTKTQRTAAIVEQSVALVDRDLQYRVACEIIGIGKDDAEASKYGNGVDWQATFDKWADGKPADRRAWVLLLAAVELQARGQWWHGDPAKAVTAAGVKLPK